MLKFSILSILILFRTYGEESPILISLGRCCHVASELRWHELRKEAYPFDWNRTSFDSLCRILEDDFAYFLDENYLVLDRLCIRHSYYGIEFMHDFPNRNPLVPPKEQISSLQDYEMSEDLICENFLDYLEPIQEKYNRRIQRFRNALSGDEKIILIRYDSEITKDQAIALHALIRSKYPKLDFSLVVCGETAEMTMDWELPGIKNYYARMAKADWTVVFRSLGLLPLISARSEDNSLHRLEGALDIH